MGSYLTLRNELSEDTCADKAGDFIGKGHLGREQQAEGTQVDHATWLAVSCFIMGFISGLSLAKHYDSESFLLVHSSLNQDGFQREGFWKDMETGVSSLLSTFLEFFLLVVAC